MEFGARIKLVGEITEIKQGDVMSLVKLKVPVGADMASVMTVESLEELGVKPGDKVRIIVKAVNVLLAKE
jgi:molybdopterin-binding protein